MAHVQRVDVTGKVETTGSQMWLYGITLAAVLFAALTIMRENGVSPDDNPACDAASVGVQKVSVDRDILECVKLRGPGDRYTYVKVSSPAASAK